jgi:hypothetical protein
MTEPSCPTSTASVSDLLARATARAVVRPTDGKSQSVFERVTIDNQGYFLKRVTPAKGWAMRVTGDRIHRPNGFVSSTMST